MKLRFGPNAAAAGEMAGMACAAVITALNGLAFVVLCLAVLLAIILMPSSAAGLTAPGVFVLIWVIGAWLVSCANIVIGLRAVDQPTWPWLAWLFGSSAGMALLYPGTLFALFDGP